MKKDLLKFAIATVAAAGIASAAMAQGSGGSGGGSDGGSCGGSSGASGAAAMPQGGSTSTNPGTHGQAKEQAKPVKPGETPTNNPPSR